jgi:hypothetical protein
LRLRRKQILIREKHVVASLAQPRTVAAKAGGDAIGIGDVGAAKTKHIRCAGFTLTRGALRCCGRPGTKKPRMLRHQRRSDVIA